MLLVADKEPADSAPSRPTSQTLIGNSSFQGLRDRPHSRMMLPHQEAPMLDAAFKALAQMFSRPFRNVLWKSIGLALILIVIVGFGLNRVLVWLAGVVQGWAEQTIGLTTNMPVTLLAWILSFATTLGIIVGSVLLM